MVQKHSVTLSSIAKEIPPGDPNATRIGKVERPSSTATEMNKLRNGDPDAESVTSGKLPKGKTVDAETGKKVK